MKLTLINIFIIVDLQYYLRLLHLIYHNFSGFTANEIPKLEYFYPFSEEDIMFNQTGYPV